MASGNYNPQQGYDQYYYYQQHPQFYYDPQNYYQGAGNSQSYNQQGADNSNYNYHPPVSNYQRNEQFERGRGYYRGSNNYNSRGRDNNNFSQKEDRKYMNKKFQSNKDSQGSASEERNDHSSESKENMPSNYQQKNPTKPYSGYRGRGRGYGQQNNPRQFYRSNNSRYNQTELTETPGIQVDSHAKHKESMAEIESVSKKEYSEQDVYDDDKKMSVSKQKGSRSYYRGGNYRSHQQHHDGYSKDSNRYGNKSNNRYSDGTGMNWKERSKNTSRGGLGSPRQVDVESRSSFEERNNPKSCENSVNTDKSNELNDKDGNSQNYKQDKTLPIDRKYTNKKQMIKKVLAGKVDDTQRGKYNVKVLIS